MADVSKFLLYLAGASKLLSAHFSQCYIRIQIVYNTLLQKL